MTINIGNPHMTCEFLKGNPRTLMYAGCNADSCIQYACCNGDSRVCNSTLRKIVWQVGSRVNASQVMPIYSVWKNSILKCPFVYQHKECRHSEGEVTFGLITDAP